MTMTTHPMRGWRLLTFTIFILVPANSFWLVKPTDRSWIPDRGMKAASSSSPSPSTVEDASLKPLLSIPIPGSSTATLQIPSPAGLKALVEDAMGEAQNVGVRSAVDRTLRSGLAAVEVATEAVSDGDLSATMTELLSSSSSSTPSSAPKLLRRLFEKLGATYIKVGQFIASSPTLFPAEYVTEFQRCLNDVSDTVPFEVVADIIEAELGASVSSIFEHIERAPLASASIAQVHAAILHESYCTGSLSSRRVVVKVRKPGVEGTLRADLAFLNVVAASLEALAPEMSRISLADTAKDLRASILGELDFRSEAASLRTFAAFLDEPRPTGTAHQSNASPALDASKEAAATYTLRQRATCPEPIAALTSEKVLVMTRLDGQPLLDALGTTSPRNSERSPSEFDPATSEAAVVAALDTWCQSVVECEFFHADLHGGNLLYLNDGRVGFLDFGIVGRLPEGTLNAVIAMREAVSQGDFVGVASSLVELGVVPRAADSAGEVDIDTLAEDLAGIFQSIQRTSTGVAAADSAAKAEVVVGGETPPGAAVEQLQDVAEVAQLALDVVATAERNGLVLPREFGLLVKQGLYFDRYLKTLAPDLNPFNDPRISLMSGSGEPTGGSQDGA